MKKLQVQGTVTTLHLPRAMCGHQFSQCQTATCDMFSHLSFSTVADVHNDLHGNMKARFAKCWSLPLNKCCRQPAACPKDKIIPYGSRQKSYKHPTNSKPGRISGRRWQANAFQKKRRSILHKRQIDTDGRLSNYRFCSKKNHGFLRKICGKSIEICPSWPWTEIVSWQEERVYTSRLLFLHQNGCGVVAVGFALVHCTPCVWQGVQMLGDASDLLSTLVNLTEIWWPQGKRNELIWGLLSKTDNAKAFYLKTH